MERLPLPGAPDMLDVVGLGLVDNKVKGLWPCMGPFEAFDSAVGRASAHVAQTNKVARGR